MSAEGILILRLGWARVLLCLNNKIFFRKNSNSLSEVILSNCIPFMSSWTSCGAEISILWGLQDVI
jgi:hypothetical protein